MRKEVPLGVDYKDIPVPKGAGAGRKEFLEQHRDPHEYVFFTEGLEDWQYKMGYEEERRLPDYTSSNENGEHYFGDTRLSDDDDLTCKEIKINRQKSDERYKLISNTDEHTTGGQIFFDARGRPLGRYLSAKEVAIRYYTFEHGEVSDRDKLYYEETTVSGGRRKRKTNKRKNKNRRTKSRRHRRS